MKKLGQANHENENDEWHFVNEDKSNQKLTDEISEYFAEISGNFVPIDRDLIPFIPRPYSPFVSEVACFPQDHEIYHLLKHSKITSSVPHDMHPTKIFEIFP